MRSGPIEPGAVEDLSPGDVERLRDSAVAGLAEEGPQTRMEETLGQALGELEALEREVASGRMEIGDYETRRTALLGGVSQSLMDLKLSHYTVSLAKAAELGAIDVILSMYLPTSAQGAAPPYTYSLYWNANPAPGILQTQIASIETGHLFVAGQTDRTVLSADGYAESGLGILVKPRHALTRIRFTPVVNFSFAHVIDTPIVPDDVDWSRASNQGKIRLIAQRLNPVTGRFESYLPKSLPQWSQSSSIGSGRYQDRGTGSYPGSDPGLLVIGSSADIFALWIVASIQVSKEDHDPNPANRTLCYGWFGFDIPVMWAEQEKLA